MAIIQDLVLTIGSRKALVNAFDIATVTEADGGGCDIVLKNVHPAASGVRIQEGGTDPAVHVYSVHVCEGIEELARMRQKVSGRHAIEPLQR